MFHECDPECKEWTDKDCYFDKWEICGMKFRRCPRVYVTEGEEFWLRAYNLYKKGFMPNGNLGWLHESNKYVEVMVFLDAQIATYQKEVSAKDGRQ